MTGEYVTLDPRFLAQTPADREALRDERITADSIGHEMVDAAKLAGGLHLEDGFSEEDEALIASARAQIAEEEANSSHNEQTS